MLTILVEDVDSEAEEVLEEVVDTPEVDLLVRTINSGMETI